MHVYTYATLDTLNVMQTFGERLGTRRKELQLSKAEIARRVGVAPPTVGQWENGENSVKGENLHALARVLQCSSEWLLTGKGPAAALSAAGKEYLTLQDAADIALVAYSIVETQAKAPNAAGFRAIYLLVDEIVRDEGIDPMQDSAKIISLAKYALRRL